MVITSTERDEEISAVCKSIFLLKETRKTNDSSWLARERTLSEVDVVVMKSSKLECI